MKYSLNYKDIYLIPQYSEIKSRSEVDISVKFLGRTWAAPWLPSNMSSVINEEISKWLSENNYFYIYHRFSDTFEFVKKANKENWKTISISIGVKDVDKELIRKIRQSTNLRVDFITIDIANGHNILVKEMLEYLKINLYSFPHGLDKTKIIAGNVCTLDAVSDLREWGADAVKIGIAGGGACSTKNQTAFHVPMFSCVKDCSVDVFTEKFPIISDGSIRENGDIAKSIVAGATMVQCGSLLAACKDAPGEDVIKHRLDDYMPIPSYDGSFYPRYKEIWYKKYYGSASKINKQRSGQEIRNVEGFEIEIPCNKLTYKQKYQEIKESLQSSCSYAGSRELNGLKNVKWIVIK